MICRSNSFTGLFALLQFLEFDLFSVGLVRASEPKSVMYSRRQHTLPSHRGDWSVESGFEKTDDKIKGTAAPLFTLGQEQCLPPSCREL